MVVAPPSPVSVNLGTLIEGDTNHDNIVDEIDYSMILLHFGQSAGTMESPTSAATCDFNGDGWVDEIDYSIILMTFGQYGVDIE